MKNLDGITRVKIRITKVTTQLAKPVVKKTISWTSIAALVLATFISVVPFGARAATINVPGSYATIQLAVNAASPGDTIVVAAGTYAEHVAVNKSLTINGANAGIAGNGARGAESIVDGTDTDAAFAITANNVTIDGFTVQNGSNGGFDAGIWSQTGTQNSKIQNNIITANAFGVWAQCGGNCLIQANLFNGNNKPGTGAGTHSISADSTTGLTINNNEFKNDTTDNPINLQAVAPGAHTNVVVANNNFHDNTNASVIYALAITGGTFSGNTILTASDVTGISFSGADHNITVTGNTITGGARGVRVEDAGYYSSAGANSNITINKNSLANNSTYGAGNTDATIANLDATCNWWGSATGPGPVGSGSGSKVTTNVTYTPWLVSSDLNSACNGGLPASVITDPATGITTTGATLNGTNGPVNADNTSFWWGTTSAGPFTAMVDPTSEFPVGWTHDAGLGSASAGGSFNEPLTGLTPGTQYHFVAWVLVGGTWYPDTILDFTTTSPAQCNPTATQSIVSDTSTQVDSHGAVAVTPNPAWTLIPADATWIYSEALNGAGSSPTGDKTFTRTFTIVGTPLDSSLEIAADNMYTVSVNGNLLTTGTSGTDLNNFSSSHTWAIPAADLLTGSNTITFTVTNPAVNPADQTPFGDPNPAGLLYKLTINNNECIVPQPPTNVNIHIFKYLDGVQATPASANNLSFPMFTSTYNAPFTLSPSGWTAGDVAYEASTGVNPLGFNYSANEDTSGSVVGTSCDIAQPKPYALVGYSTGDTLVAAQGATVSTTIPNFTNLQGDKYIIVWNKTCEVTAPTTLKVHIQKYLNGSLATAVSANNYLFPMTATWNAVNIGAGTGSYVLGTSFGGAADLYGADTAAMSSPADYTTSEITDTPAK